MLIAEARQAGAREEKACTELEITLRTLQRWRLDTQGQGDRRPTAQRPIPKNKLTIDEEQQILAVTNQAEFWVMVQSSYKVKGHRIFTGILSCNPQNIVYKLNFSNLVICQVHK